MPYKSVNLKNNNTNKKTTHTLTKADIAAAVHREIGLSKSESSSLVAACLDHISSTLTEGKDVKLTNFGTFKLKHKKARFGRNPRTGEAAPVSERTIVNYKAAPHVMDRVNLNSKTKKMRTDTHPQNTRIIAHISKQKLLELLSKKLGCL